MKKIFVKLEIVVGVVLFLIGYGIIPIVDEEPRRQFNLAARMIQNQLRLNESVPGLKDSDVIKLIEYGEASMENSSKLKGVIIFAGAFLVITGICRLPVGKKSRVKNA